MATVLNVARYVIKRCGSMTTMKLEKLVYYCQAWSLGWDDVPLFNEDFEAWANGPVCPQLFNEHRGLFVVSNIFLNDLQDYNFSDSEIETMDSVIDYYGDKEPQWLSELIHKEAPWKEARKGIPDGESCNRIITKDSMLQYYGGLNG